MARTWLDPWAGGRCFVDRHGRTRWALERMVDGKRFSKTLEARSESEALAELALFEREPSKDATSKEQHREARATGVVVDAQSVAAVAAHLRAPPKQRDPHYIDNVVRYLAQWGEDLAGRDLRTVKTDELKRMLNRHPTARQKRIAALKTFTAFFREEENTLPIGADPTVALMSIPSRPAKLRKEKGYPMEVVERVYASVFDWESERSAPDRFGRHRPRGSPVAARRLGWADLQGVRDVLVLRAKFGMHHSEISRLCCGKGIIKPTPGQGEIAGTIRFTHKSTREHLLSLDAQGLAAARRLAAHGAPISDSFLRTTLLHASRRAGLAHPLAPNELRHSFVTWATEQGREVRPKQGGVPVETVARVVGHSGTRTTTNFYLGVQVPVMIAIPLKLYHPEDPSPMVLQVVRGEDASA